jgi:hypothetical protein
VAHGLHPGPFTMVRPQPMRRGGSRDNLSTEERRSVTHGDFWIPEDARQVYRLALETLNQASLPYVIAGAFAIYEHTGIYRQTKDLDLFFEPKDLLPAAYALRDAGFDLRLEEPHWLAKAYGSAGDAFVDLIFGMGNGVAFIDGVWHAFARPGTLAGTPVMIAPAEELLWHRLFIHERHRQDMADIQHLIISVGDTLDWDRLLKRVGPHWPLLLAQLQVFAYVYPGFRSRVPRHIMETLLDRAREQAGKDDPDEAITNGPLISKFSFAIDTQEWGFVDTRAERVRRALHSEPIQRIATDPIWTSSRSTPNDESRRTKASAPIENQ